MKKTYFIFLFLLGLFLMACAGMATVKEEDKTFSKVYNTPGFSKEQLYEGGKIWIANTFKSAKAVIEYDNKENGTIIGNGYIKYPCNGLDCIAKGNWKIGFTMKYEAKDERFRLTFESLTLSWPSSVDSLGYHPAYEGTMWQQGDYDLAKPILLDLGLLAELCQSC